MEGSSKQNPIGSSSEQNSESDSPRTESSPAQARIHTFSHKKTAVNLSHKLQDLHDHTQQQPYEGPCVSSVKKDEGGDQATGGLYHKERSDSATSHTYDYDMILEPSYEDTETTYHGSRRNTNSLDRFDTLGCIDSVPLVGEQSSCSSECNTTPFVAPFFDDEVDSPRRSDDCVPPVLETIARGNDSPKPLIKPILSSDMKDEHENRHQPQLPCNHQSQSQSARQAQECLRHRLQTDPPQEITLQPSALTKVPQTSQKSRVPLSDYCKMSHTPPPSYQESLSYPVVQHQPLPVPDYTPMSMCTRPKDPVVSIIRLSPPMPQTSSMINPHTRDSVYVWHSPSSEACSRHSRVQDQYSDHQILALLACIMFWPVGLLAIYYANMANILRSEGVHGKSLIYSKRALLLSLVSFLIGTGVYLTFYLQRQLAL